MKESLGDTAASWQGPGTRLRLPRRFRWSDLLWQLIFPRNTHRVLPTTSGAVLIALCLGLGTAAYNSANNILFITLSLLLACLILSGLLSWLNFRGVSWRVHFAAPWRVGKATAVILELRNTKHFMPTHGLWFDVVTAPVPRGRVDRPAIPTKGRTVRQILAAAEQHRGRARLFQRSRLDAGGELRVDWAFTPTQRGKLRFSLESAGSRFPFGFLQKSMATTLRREVTVWPAPVEYRRWGSTAGRPQVAGERVTRPGSSGDLLALRKYEIGDSHRLIHWKASARTQQLLVRQFAAESQETLALWLETPGDRWTRPAQFELLVSFAATLAEDLFRSGKLASVTLNGEAPRPVRRVADLEAFLDDVAMIEPIPEGGENSRQPTNPGPAARRTLSARRNVLVFVPDGPHGVAAYVDGEKTAAT